MKFILNIVFFIIAFVGCDSPMNNRVDDSGSINKQSSEQKNFSSDQMAAEVRWLKGPFGNINEVNHLLVFLYVDGELTSLPNDQTLAFYATMPSMGHPMEDAGFFEEIEEGIYLNKTIRYNMPGDWKNELWVMDQDFNIKDRLDWLILF